MTPNHLHLLIDRSLDQLAKPADLSELERELLQSPEARRQYVRACMLETVLVDSYDNQQDCSMTAPHSGQSATPSSTSTRGIWRITTSHMAALAAGLFIAVVLMQALGGALTPWPAAVVRLDALNPVSEDLENQQVVAPSSAPVSKSSLPANAIGRIVRKIDCVWNDEAWSLASSTHIAAGQTINLERGLMSLELSNGVKVLLDGPAEFTATTPLHGTLAFGGIGVRVPNGLSGYVIDTPSAQVTDLGTEFSVLVNNSGVTKLRVIDGEVLARVRLAKGQLAEESAELLADNQYWDSLRGAHDVGEVPLQADFPKVSLLEGFDVENIHPLPATEDLALWMRADHAVKLDGRNRVIAWGDISSERSYLQHSAWQVTPRRRPQHVPDGVGGRPTIRFDGVNDCLVTQPYDSSDSQTVVMVARLDRLRGKRGSLPAQQLLNCNGPPHLVLEYRWSSHQLRARSFNLDNQQPVHSGWVVGRQISAGEPLGLVYIYDHDRDLSALYLNGELQGEARAKFGVASSRPKVLGLHRQLRHGGLVGDISEVAMYNRALDKEEVLRLNDYLVERYDLSGMAAKPRKAEASAPAVN